MNPANRTTRPLNKLYSWDRYVSELLRAIVPVSKQICRIKVANINTNHKTDINSPRTKVSALAIQPEFFSFPRVL